MLTATAVGATTGFVGSVRRSSATSPESPADIDRLPGTVSLETGVDDGGLFRVVPTE